MNDDPDIALVLSCYEAFGRGDIAAAVALLAPDVEWIEPDEFPNGGARRGPAAVADYLQASYDSWAELHSEPTARRQADRIVVALHRPRRVRGAHAGVRRSRTDARRLTHYRGPQPRFQPSG